MTAAKQGTRYLSDLTIQRLQAEAARLRSWDEDNSDLHFDMSYYYKPSQGGCGTTCCIAGDIFIQHYPDEGLPRLGSVPRKQVHENILESYESGKDCWYSNIIDAFASIYLGLREFEADWLFAGVFTKKYLQDITPQEAAQAIDFFIANDGQIAEVEDGVERYRYITVD